MYSILNHSNFKITVANHFVNLGYIGERRGGAYNIFLPQHSKVSSSASKLFTGLKKNKNSFYFFNTWSNIDLSLVVVVPNGCC